MRNSEYLWGNAISLGLLLYIRLWLIEKSRINLALYGQYAPPLWNSFIFQLIQHWRVCRLLPIEFDALPGMAFYVKKCIKVDVSHGSTCISPKGRTRKKEIAPLLHGPNIFALQKNRRPLLDSMVPLLMANGAHNITLFKMLWCAIATVPGLWERSKAS